MGDARRGPGRIGFRGVLLLSLLGVLLLTAAVIGTASSLLAGFAVEDLGGKVLGAASDRIERHVGATLHVAESQSRIIDELIRSGAFAIDDHEGLTRVATSAIDALEDLSYLSLGLESGKYWHVFRDDVGRVSVLWLLPGPAGHRRLVEFFPLPGGGREPIQEIERSKRTPPTERPYYIAAAAAGQPIWTETYVFLGTGEALDIPGVSRATPILDAAGTLRGVLTADFDLHAMSRFLRAAPVGERGFAFIVEERADGSHRVIAHPDAAHPDAARRLALTRAAPDGGGQVTVGVDEIADPRVPAVVRGLGARSAESGDGAAVARVEAPDGTWLAGVRRLRGEGAPPWTICTLLPRDEIVGDIRRMAFVTIGIAAAGVLAVIIFAVWLSGRVARALRAIAVETEEVARFHLDPRPAVPSRIGEIARLGAAVEEMKAGLRSFGRYVPADLVRLILESGEEARLGGTRRTITIYFSDIAGFTSISEQMSPEELVELLAEYLDAMTREMMGAGGTVDKYIGDAIMAFWGAPRPIADHPIVACRTALRNQATLARLREKWSAAGKPALRARIGLHTGEAIVGNFGSESRLDYTAIGDAVNLASRLEGLNRHYGTEILLSESTHDLVREQVIARPIDRIAVKGRAQGIVVHELIGLAGEVAPERVDRAAAHGRAFAAYLDRRWDEAREILDGLLAAEPDDPPATLLRDRAAALAADPPRDWTGIHRMEAK